MTQTMPRSWQMKHGASSRMRRKQLSMRLRRRKRKRNPRTLLRKLMLKMKQRKMREMNLILKLRPKPNQKLARRPRRKTPLLMMSYDGKEVEDSRPKFSSLCFMF
ncbi:uncharacterized protein LOC125591677 [Brassica napus]|uniref:uncharacterized protein LOC125591677 n=1 Tax=Brassica napus TaxID=3708 RepID=UPI002079220D|nr:uncharacterized protein LOC125591677 [Brassica napus]